MLRPAKRIAVAGALLTAALLAASCSSSVGPLGSAADDSGTMCAHGSQDKPVTFGFYTLKDNGSQPVTVTSVKLPPDAKGLAMTKVWLVPIWHKGTHSDVIGVGFPWPPNVHQVGGETWPQRKPAAGGIIQPHQNLGVVFGLTRTTAKDGHSSGPVITYSAGGNTFVLREGISMVIAAGECS